MAPEEALDRKQTEKLLEQAMDALPTSYRLALMLRDIEQMSTAQAAEVMGVTEGNLRVLLHRARAALREELYRVSRGVVDEHLGAGRSGDDFWRAKCHCC